MHRCTVISISTVRTTMSVDGEPTPQSSDIHQENTICNKVLANNLSTSIAPIYYKIRPGSIRTSITSQIQIHALELPGICIPSQRRQSIPFILHLNWTIAANGRVDVSGTDTVDSGEPCPFHGQGLGQVDYSRFAGIVAGLSLVSVL